MHGPLRWVASESGDRTRAEALSLLAVIVFFAGVALLFRSRYPRGIFDLAIGIDRWGFRVCVYATLMTDAYPPFRLDQGGADPGLPRPPAPTSPGFGGALASDPTQPSPSAPVGSASGSPAGRVVALVVGVLAVVLALAVAGIGGTGLWLNTQRDSDGYISTRTQAVSSSTAAVTVEDVNVHIDRSTATWLAARDLGRLRVEVTPDGGKPVFVGIAAQSDVDRWLAGRAHDEITRISGDTLKYTRQAGAASVTAPAQQDFWTASTSAAGPTELNWRATSGRWALVTANADGSAGVQVHISVAARIPSLVGVATGLLVAALVFLVLAAALIFWAATGLGRHHAGGTGTPVPQPPRTPVPA